MFLRLKKSRSIFVGGIHGVGKSTICSDISTELNILHLTASDLIRQYKKESSIQDKDRGKHVGNISKNQDILVSALNNSVVKDDIFILDGHFTILDAQGVVRQVPSSVFSEINPKALFIITEKPEVIQLRLMKRDETVYDLREIGQMQDAELAHAAGVAKETGLKMYELASSQSTQLRDYIKNIMN